MNGRVSDHNAQYYCINGDDQSDVSSLHDNSYISDGYKEEVKSTGSSNILKETFMEQQTSRLQLSGAYAIFKSQIENNYNKKIIESTIEFKDMKTLEIKTLKRKKFAYCRNDLITTYHVRNNCFSQFTYPKTIEQDKQVDVFVLERNKKKDKFICEDINNIISELGITKKVNELSTNITLFLDNINNIFLNKSYINTKQKIFCWNLFCYVLLFCLIACCCLLIVSLFFKVVFSQEFILDSQNILIALICLVCILIFLLIYYISTLSLLKQFKLIDYMLLRYKNNVQLVESWNKSVFYQSNVIVSIPVSVDYILFNKNPKQDIVITNIEFDAFNKNIIPNYNLESVDPIELIGN